jgi:thiosulfate dehydrogenase [quinone] large subunit
MRLLKKLFSVRLTTSVKKNKVRKIPLWCINLKEGYPYMGIEFLTRTNKWLFPSLMIVIRVLFGIGWLLAGVTKITEKQWFSEPGVFLNNYLIKALNNPNVPLFYQNFIENVALEFVTPLNYIIPIVQILLGLFIIVGFMTIPSILLFLFMHINFILSGNMNLISLVLYTSAFTLIIYKVDIYHFSLDRYLHLEKLFTFKKKQENVSVQGERLFH